MKQILQHLKSGEMELAEVPAPMPGRGEVLVRTQRSVISAGTERMLVEFSQANLISKARQQPEKVKQVLDKMRTDGLVPTLEAVFRKLDEPMPLGYCNAGVIEAVGAGIHDLAPGDRVISNGPHAEAVCVPRNLVAKIPDGVPEEEAAFTVLGAIALQGVRLTQPTLGERIAVFGMGLLGLITVQLLRSSGCEVLAIDINAERLELAKGYGAQTVDLSGGGDPVRAAMAMTSGAGIDGALITASAKTDDIMHQAAQSCRRRGRIVLVGVVGLNLRRSDFYEKELTFQVSCSYGPGRYDEKYEQQGQDYPLGFVRWTEQRNFEAVLGAMAAGRLSVKELITHRFPLDQATDAYEKVQNDGSALGVVLEYAEDAELKPRVSLIIQKSAATPNAPTVAVIGTGNFARAVILPGIEKAGGRLKYVCARSKAAGAIHAARKFGAENVVMDSAEVLNDPEIDAVFVVTGHHVHARMVSDALEAGKHVFVEKPLAIDAEQLAQVRKAVNAHGDRQLLVGFNRRFSPHARKMRELLRGHSEPLAMTMTVNAGEIPAEHWIQDPERGGGRIIGEACHFIDLMVSLRGSQVKTVAALMMGRGTAVQSDKMSIVMNFEDGSVGTLNYFANGPKAFMKEGLEVFSDGRVLRLENFRRLLGFGFDGFSQYRTPRQDKGHRAEIAAFLDKVREGGAPLIPYAELENVTQASFAAMASAREQRMIPVVIPAAAEEDAGAAPAPSTLGNTNGSD